MTKYFLSREKLEAVCLMALIGRKIPVTGVELAVLGRNGARANWELRALTPEPDYETAKASLEAICELQDTFDLEGNPKAAQGVLS